jgi:hypothetical protein
VEASSAVFLRLALSAKVAFGGRTIMSRNMLSTEDGFIFGLALELLLR